MPILPTRPPLTPSLAANDKVHVVQTDNPIDDPTGSSRYMTAQQIKDFTSPPASEIIEGIIETADQAETDAGVVDDKAITPLKLQNKKATETAEGIIEIPTQIEHNAGILDDKAVTPKKLADGKWGAYVVLEQQNAASDAAIEFTNLDGTYEHYIVEITDLVAQNNDVDIRLRVSEDNGATFKAGASDYNWIITGKSADNKDPTSNSNGSDYIPLAGVVGGGKGLGNAAGEAYEGSLVIHDVGSSSTFKNISTRAIYANTNGFTMLVNNAGMYFGTTNPIDAVQIFLSSGLIVSGSFELYGLK